MKKTIVLLGLIVALLAGCAPSLAFDSPLPTPTPRVYEDWELVFQCMSDCTGSEEELLACYAACREKYASTDRQQGHVVFLPVVVVELEVQ